MLIFARGDLPLPDRLAPRLVRGAAQCRRTPCAGHAGALAVRQPHGELLCNRDTLVGTVLNLIENAIQAGGREARLKVHLYQRGETLRLCISDNGPRHRQRTLARLGEPFFTTKTTGTGLGLAVVKAVARAHQGDVQLRSRLGRGTCAI